MPEAAPALPTIYIASLPSVYARVLCDEARAILSRFAKIERNLEERLLGDDEMSQRIAHAEGVIVGWPGQSNGLSRANIEAATKLRIIGQLGQSVKRIDTAAVFERKLTLVNGPSAFADAVAEFTLAQMLSVRHRVHLHDRAMRAGTEAWGTRDGGALGRELSRSVVGLIGLGWIGRRVAELLRPFHVELLVFDPFATPEAASAAGAVLVTLPELLSRCEVVSMHAGLTPQTARMMGRKEFETMKPDALFINTGRGGLVDEDALIAHLRAHPSFTAALDVYASEPLPADSPLRTMDNVLLSSHRSGHTVQSYEKMGVQLAQDFQRFFANQPPVNVLTPEQLARMS